MASSSRQVSPSTASPSPPTRGERGPIFYGWWVALALSVAVFLSSGLRFSTGPFLKPMVADLGIDRASFSLVVSLSLLLYGVFMPLVSRLVDRVGARPVTVAGAVVSLAIDERARRVPQWSPAAGWR